MATDTEIKEQAIAAIAAGMSVPDASKEFDVSESTLYRWCQSDGRVKSAKDLRDIRNAALIEEYVANEEPISRICARHHITQNTMYRILDVNNIPRRIKERLSIEDATKLVLDLFDAGATIMTIREKTHKGYPFIYNTLDENGRDRRLHRTHFSEGTITETSAVDAVMEKANAAAAAKKAAILADYNATAAAVAAADDTDVDDDDLSINISDLE